MITFTYQEASNAGKHGGINRNNKPPQTKFGEYIGITLSVCPSVCVLLEGVFKKGPYFDYAYVYSPVQQLHPLTVLLTMFMVSNTTL